MGGKKTLKQSHILKSVVFGVVIALFAFGYASFAQAGAFSFLEKMFGFNSSAANEPVEAKNTQNMDLLKPVFNSDPKAATGDVNITIVNQNAILPDSGPIGTTADIKDIQPPSDQISLYVVKKNDTLSQIAEMFDVSVNTIILANDIQNGVIQPGQELIILPISGIQYAVKRGDTIEGIAKKFKSDAEEILSFNDIRSENELSIGDIIIIPNGDYSTPSSNSTASQPKKPSYAPSTMAYAQGYYTRPIRAGIKTQGFHGYNRNAVDLADSCGTAVFAAAKGTVRISKMGGWNAGAGNYIVIVHPNGTQTLYAHLQKTFVSPGETVDKGQIIAYMGTSGNSTGCHLHFEIRGGIVNPF